MVDCVWNVMAHAQKPDFVFRRNRRVHLNRRGHQFSRLLAAEVCASAVVMLDTPCSEVVWEYWLPTAFASFPFTSPHVRHRVTSGFNWTLPNTYTHTNLQAHRYTVISYPGMKIFCLNLSLKRIVSFASGTFTKSTENETQLKEEIKLKIIQTPTE